MDAIMLTTDWIETTQDLTWPEKGRLIEAVMMYARGEEPGNLLEGNEVIAYRFLTKQIDAQRAEADEADTLTEKRRAAGKKGGRPRKEQAAAFELENQTKANETSENQTKANESKIGFAFSEENQSVDKSNNVLHTHTDNVIEINNKTNNQSVGSNPVCSNPVNTAFIPPTYSEVREYCEANGLTVSAERFVAYYAARGWQTGSGPMVDWQASLRYWETTEGRFTGPAKQEPVNPALRYTQRTYTAEDHADILKRHMERAEAYLLGRG